MEGIASPRLQVQSDNPFSLDTTVYTGYNGPTSWAPLGSVVTAMVLQPRSAPCLTAVVTALARAPRSRWAEALALFREAEDSGALRVDAHLASALATESARALAVTIQLVQVASWAPPGCTIFGCNFLCFSSHENFPLCTRRNPR